MVAVREPDGTAEADEGVSADVLTQEMRGLHDAMLACHAALLGVISEYDRRGLFEADGSHSMGDWLTMALGVSAQTGRDWARTAKRLAELPALTEAFADGDLSYDQTRVLARFVTPDDDEAWAQDGPKHSVDALCRIARKARPVTPQESQDRHAERRLDWYWNHETGMVDLKGRLPEDSGQTVVKALERVVDGLMHDHRDDAGPGERVPYAALLADALVELAGQQVAADADPDRATLIVQVDAADLARRDTTVTDPDCTGGPVERGGWIEGGPAIAAETVRRLGCDCRYQSITFDEYGIAIGLGRTQRSVPPSVSRALVLRDVTCRWPGCGRSRRLHIHHVVFWANGGRTDSDNCCAMCPAHHRLLHEGRYQITGNANTTLTFRRPDGTLVATSRPPPR